MRGCTPSKFFPGATCQTLGVVIHNRILIVDDEPDVLRVTARVLRRGGAVVDVATSAMEALRLINSGQEYSCILTDYKMPGISGVELILMLPPMLQQRCVMITASVASEVPTHRLPCGIRVLHKPVDMGQLREAIAEAGDRRVST